MRLLFVVLAFCCGTSLAASDSANPTLAAPERPVGQISAYAGWKQGPPTEETFFPIGVWLQNPVNAARYKRAGINVYVGLWRGPTVERLHALRASGMHVVCEQNAIALEDKEGSCIIGWMHGDEPDNAQSLPGRKGYGPPITPAVIAQDYARMRRMDSTRPVFLNLGQGVAWDDYIGRGVRRRHPEDYSEYVKGCDIASFDIYPVVHDDPAIAGKLEYVGSGVSRLRHWSGPNKLVWNCIECTHISNPAKRASPDQVRTEVWMSLIHGSRGIIYFVHQFKPVFREAALLDDAEMLAAVTTINAQIRQLAPVLNSPDIRAGVEVVARGGEDQSDSPGPQSSLSGASPIAWVCKRRNQTLYLFTVNMTNAPVTAGFVFDSVPGITADVTVLHEERQLLADRNQFTDEFQPYQVHLYAVNIP